MSSRALRAAGNQEGDETVDAPIATCATYAKLANHKFPAMDASAREEPGSDEAGPSLSKNLAERSSLCDYTPPSHWMDNESIDQYQADKEHYAGRAHRARQTVSDQRRSTKFASTAC
jgi:hypothetical protein